MGGLCTALAKQSLSECNNKSEVYSSPRTEQGICNEIASVKLYLYNAENSVETLRHMSRLNYLKTCTHFYSRLETRVERIHTAFKLKNDRM